MSITPKWKAAELPLSNKEEIQAAILAVTRRQTTLSDLKSPCSSTPYIKIARRMVQQFLNGGKRILIQSDFDADGITSAVVWARHLRKNTEVLTVIPDRSQGHSSLVPLENALKTFNPDRVIVLDSGTNQLPKIALIAAGRPCLVVDHHQPEKPDYQPTEGVQLINPHTFPGPMLEKDLSTAGLSGYILENLDQKSKLLAGIGQVGDIMPLSKLSYQMAQQTLNLIATGDNTGLAALLPKEISLQGLSFQTIPRINAVSRMAHSLLIYSLLLDDNPPAQMFLEIERLNQERKDVTAKFMEAITDQINDAPIQVIYVPELPGSLAGPLASKVSQETYKPVLCLSNTASGDIGGSFRSPIDLDLAALITQLKANGICKSGGGHKRAAGLTLAFNQLDRLKTALSQVSLPEESRTFIPAPSMPFAQLTAIYAETEPFGSGTPPPIWGIPFFNPQIKTLYSKKNGQAWANKGTLSTPQGTISFLETAKVHWKQAGLAFGYIEFDAFMQEYLLKIVAIE